MAQNKLFAVLIFLALIPALEGRLLKFDSERLCAYKRFLADETARVVEDRSSLQITVDIEASGAEMQGSSPSLAPTGVVVVASQSPPPGHVGYFGSPKPGQRPAGVGTSPPPHYSDEHATFSTQKKGPLGPPAPTANTPIHN